MLMRPYEDVMVSGLVFVAGGHLCQTASTLISRVASMPDQGEKPSTTVHACCDTVSAYQLIWQSLTTSDSHVPCSRNSNALKLSLCSHR